MITEKQVEICESLDWKIHEYDDGSIDLESYSPEGEDLIFTINAGEEFVHGICSIAVNFDVDEHVKMWIPSLGENGVPGSISALVEDAKEIEQMLYELVAALRK